MWKELTRRMKRGPKDGATWPDPPQARYPPARFVNPATWVKSQGAGERTIRFVNPATWVKSQVAGERTIRFVNPATWVKSQGAGERTIRFVSKDRPYRQITDVREYRYDDIQPEDRVLDIGANIGAFCLRAAQFSTYVTAVEPVAVEILRENIRLNQAKVEVIAGALGDGNPMVIDWDGTRVRVRTCTLGQIIRMTGGCDFLKCDCEGAEWLIRPEELSGIRRIEMELHLPPIGGPPNEALLGYIGSHYEFSIERRPVHQSLGVMGVLHASSLEEEGAA